MRRLCPRDNPELKRLPGVTSVEVSFTNKLAVVAYDTNQMFQSKLERVVREAGDEAVGLPRQKARRP
jgi:copper chaperone CopZ